MVEESGRITASSPLDLLFLPGERLGWTFRDIRQLFRPYHKPVPEPRSVSPRAAMAADRARARLPRRIAAALLFTGCFFLILTSQLHFYVFPSGVVSAVFFCVTAGPLLLHFLIVRRWADPQRSHERATAAWRQRRKKFEESEARRLMDVAEWGTVPPPHTTRFDLIGGDTREWQRLLVVFGASMLATHESLTVVDLSQADVSEGLVEVASRRAIPCTTQVFPRDLADSDLLVGLRGPELVEVLVEAMRADVTGPTRTDRLADRQILSEICRALHDHVTVTRLSAAVRVLMEKPGPTPELTLAERTTIADELFADEVRRRILPDLWRLDAHLHPLRELGGRGRRPKTGNLDVIAVQDHGGNAAGELLHDLILQRLIRRITEQPDEIRVLVIAGADGLAAKHLTRLSDQCAQHGVRLVLIFRRLQDAARQMLDRGPVGFMRLGNHEDATVAAEYIGYEHKFVVSQQTRTVGGSDNKSYSAAAGESSSAQGWQWSWTETVTIGTSTEQSTATTTERVREYTVEPTTLQSLPDNTLLLVEAHVNGPILTVVNCDPSTLTLPRVSMQPLRDSPRNR
ncbi:hypothetical protein [Amycolatopsis sp. DG1A-15b]|uniref:hypothetical protein n=1 Tax=Amycolatopsis sp. DG1A-15b TaxID=3052846 RepID=UPI00255B7DBC|nr:hypothetical protein [Amycolatopsis sp. DG1A-15b]WIX92505.1 hypothetical protein QRY02_19515 [Amycolatopsis sp. DG1A-15b]